ncbi:unnamed protein product [Microthlaspi erraticum]|uniref:Uncharacterized protein n=1 Tax=Microthlaspi erraticum TaxID=1685480 RepID=A0A6D2J0D6_9BRAS|nr:unnamed protein product [Microthlaspi erraticum]
MASRPVVGQSSPTRTDASAVVRERVARPRGLVPRSRGMVVCVAAWSVCSLADRGTMFPGSCCVIGRSVSNFGRDFRRTDVTLAERETIVSRPTGLCGWALILDKAV